MASKSIGTGIHPNKLKYKDGLAPYGWAENDGNYYHTADYKIKANESAKTNVSTYDVVNSTYGKLLDAVDIEWAPYSTNEKSLRTSSDVIEAINNAGVKNITIKTGSTNNQNITIGTFLTWMVATKSYIPGNTMCHRIFRTSWSYEDNDNLCINDKDSTKEYIGLEGSTIEFTGYIYYSGSGDIDLTLRDKHNFEIKFTCAPTVYGTSYPRSIWVYRNNSGNYQPGFDIIIGKQYNCSSTQTGEIFNNYTNNVASGVYSHSEGQATTASGPDSHAEGKSTTASNVAAHAEGYSTTASGDSSHAEGRSNTAFGENSHAEGRNNIASGQYSHVEGYYTNTVKGKGYGGHAEGYGYNSNNMIVSSAKGAHAEGYINVDGGVSSSIDAAGNGAHAEGSTYAWTSISKIVSNGVGSHAEGYVENGNIYSSGHGSHTEGVGAGSLKLNASSLGSHAEGLDTCSAANASHAEGSYTSAVGVCSHAEGTLTVASGSYSHAEGYGRRPSIIDKVSVSIVNTTFSGKSYKYKLTTSGAGNCGIPLSTSNPIAIFKTDNTFVGITKDLITGSTNYAYLFNLESGYDIANSNSYLFRYISAIGSYSHSEGVGTIAQGEAGHAEGKSTFSGGKCSHSEGYSTFANAQGAHAEGSSTTSSGTASHAEGYATKAQGNYSHAEGESTNAAAVNSHAEGQATGANGYRSHAEGVYSYTSGDGAHAEGYITVATGTGSHSEGMCGILKVASTYSANSTTIVIKKSNNWSAVRVGMYIITWKHWTKITAISTSDTTRTLTLAWALGEAKAVDDVLYLANTALGNGSHVEGSLTLASGNCSHAEGYATIAGHYSHSEGSWTTASGQYAHVEGQSNMASGDYSHAEGQSNTASGQYAHVEGYDSLASGLASHAEGKSNTASGIYSHSGGCNSTSSQAYSFVHGCKLSVSNTYEVAFGKYNKTNTGQRFSIGNGTSTANSNAFEVYNDGTTYVRGPLKVGKSNTTSYIAFYGTTGDEPGLYQTSFIGEHIWAGTESSELLLMKYNDGPNASGTTSTTPTTSGPDRIRHIAHGHIFQIPTDSSHGDFISMANSSNVSTKLDISTKLTSSYNSILIAGPASATMSNATANPRLIFGDLENGVVNQKVGIIYTDYDTYRPSKGLKVGDVDGVDANNVWFEVQGFTYSAGFYKNGSSNDYALTGQGGHIYIPDLYTKFSRRIYNYSNANDWVRFATLTLSNEDTLATCGFTIILNNRECLDNTSSIVTLAIRRSTRSNITCKFYVNGVQESLPRTMTVRSNDGYKFYVYIKSALNSWTTYYSITPIYTDGSVVWENTGLPEAKLVSGTSLNINASTGGYVNYSLTSNNADKVDNYHVVVENGVHTGSSNDTLYFVTGGETSVNFLPLDTGKSITDYPYVIAEAQTYFQTHIKIAGNVYATSDIRVKNVLNAWTINIEQLASLPIFNYTWKNKDDNTVHIGTSAQAVEEIIPELVSDNGEKSLDYSTLGTIAGIMSAREIVKLKEENKQLKSEIELLKNQLSEIKDIISKIQK